MQQESRLLIDMSVQLVTSINFPTNDSLQETEDYDPEYKEENEATDINYDSFNKIDSLSKDILKNKDEIKMFEASNKEVL